MGALSTAKSAQDALLVRTWSSKRSISQPLGLPNVIDDRAERSIYFAKMNINMDCIRGSPVRMDECPSKTVTNKQRHKEKTNSSDARFLGNARQRCRSKCEQSRGQLGSLKEVVNVLCMHDGCNYRKQRHKYKRVASSLLVELFLLGQAKRGRGESDCDCQKTIIKLGEIQD